MKDNKNPQKLTRLGKVTSIVPRLEFILLTIVYIRLDEGICIRINELLGLTVIESGAPILSALMFRVIHGPSFQISDAEIPQDQSSLDIDCILGVYIESCSYETSAVALH